MRPFEFVAPENVAEACDALAQHGAAAQPMAGGQTLLLQMKPRLSSPQVVVHIGRLDSLRGWTHDNGQLALGAATSYATLEDASPLVGAHELLRHVASNLADRAVRNYGTIGGSISAAVSNYDVPVALLALDARLVLRSSTRERTLTVDQLVQGNGITAREPDELLERLLLPAREQWRWSFQKFRRRLADPAAASVATLVRLADNGTIADSRIVVGAVTDQPVRLTGVEDALRGTSPDADTAEIAALAAAETTPHLSATLRCSTGYAQQLVRILTARTLHIVAKDARWRN